MLSLGPIEEGYLLVVSNEHFECCAELRGKIAEEFDAIVGRVKLILHREYGKALVFEHGRSGSCLYSLSHDKHCHHAHMHCVPTNVDLAAITECDFSSTSLTSWDDFRNTYQKYLRDYLFIEQDDLRKMFFVNKEIGRQYLRQRLATALGVERLADWVKSPGWRKIWRAKKRLRSYFVDFDMRMK